VKKQTRLIAPLFLMIAMLAVMASLPQRTAQANCITAVCTPVPSRQAKQKNQVHTKVPPTDTATPSPTATDTAEPTATEPAPSATAAPVMANSALVATPSCGSPAPASSPSPTPAPSGGLGSLFPWLMGGGGLILGLGVGFFTGGVRGKTNWNGDGIVGPDKNWNGPITTANVSGPSMDKWDKFDKWQKGRMDGEIHTADYDNNVESTRNFVSALEAETGFPTLDAASKDPGTMTGPSQPQSDKWYKFDKWNKFDKWQKAAPETDLTNAKDKWQKADAGPGDADAVNMFHKGQDAGWNGDGYEAGTGDGSVQPADLANQLGANEAGMADGSVRPTDFLKKLGDDTPGSDISANFDK
jgi:hypothetical protein